MTNPFDVAKAALRVGGEIKSVACQYTVSINGVPVGVVSASEHAQLQELSARLKLEAGQGVSSHKLRMLTRAHLQDLGRDLGIAVEGLSKMELVAALLEKGFDL